KMETDSSHQQLARGDINGRLGGDARFVFGREFRLRQNAFKFILTGNQPLDDIFALGNEQARLPREIASRQIAIGCQSWIVDVSDGNRRHYVAPTNIGTTCVCNSPPVTCTCPSLSMSTSTSLRMPNSSR